MTDTQREQILNAHAFLSNVLRENELLNTTDEIQLDQYYSDLRLSEIRYLIERILFVVERLFSSVEYKLITGFTAQNGSFLDIYQQLSTIGTAASQNRFADLVPNIKLLSQSFIKSGFWYSDNREELNNDPEFKLDDLRKKARDIRKFHGLASKGMSQVDDLRTQLDTFAKHHDAAYNAWEIFQKNAENQNETVKSKKDEAVNLVAEIKTLHHMAQSSTDDFKKDKKDFESDTEAIRNELEEIEKKMNREIALAHDQFSEANTQHSRYEKILADLQETIGLKSASNLFETFEKRKKELDVPLRNWAIAIGAISIVCLLVVLTLFAGLHFDGYTPTLSMVKFEDWKSVAVGFIRTLPFFVILYFAISQYIKERNFQEEYAFRSTLALSIRAYSELAGDRKGELFEKASKGIFDLPMSLRDKPNPFQLKSKREMRIVEDLISAIRDQVKK